MTATPVTHRGLLRSWGLWTAGFLAFPIAGLAGRAIAGPVDDLLAALVGGATPGLVIGVGQSLAGRGALSLRRAGSLPQPPARPLASPLALPQSGTAPPSPTWRSWDCSPESP
jgi:hypothetical protein